MQQAARRRTRMMGTFAVALAHLWLVAVGIFGRLDYTVPSRYEIVALVAQDNLWIPLHLACALALLVGLWRDQGWEWRACSASFAIMLAWSFFTLLWGISAIEPVSLASPGLAAFAAVGAHVLANAWIREQRDKGR